MSSPGLIGRRHDPQVHADAGRHLIDKRVSLLHRGLASERKADLDAAVELVGQERIVRCNERGPKALGGRRLLQPDLETEATFDLPHGDTLSLRALAVRW